MPTPRVRRHGIAVLVAALVVALAHCGSDGEPAPAAPPTGMATGELRVYATQVIPPSARAEVLRLRAEVERAGGKLAPDGSYVSSPSVGAGGWTIRLGEKVAFTDTAGRFTIEVAPGDPATADVFHPGQPDDVAYRLPIADLARGTDVPVPVEFELRQRGPCGMNPDPAPIPGLECDQPLDVDKGVAASALQAQGGAHHGHHHEDTHVHVAPVTGVVEPQHFAQPANAQYSAELGSYAQGNQVCCLDYNGPKGNPASYPGVLIAYLGSTCERRFTAGCCGDENGGLWVSAKVAFGFVPKSCKDNHKGRFCQELTPGDVALRVDGTRIVSDTSGVGFAVDDRPVKPGEEVYVIVHNNGCYGETRVQVVSATFGGKLAGPNYVPARGTILHYDGAKGSYTYWADRHVVYTAPRCFSAAQANPIDHYRFNVDGRAVNQIFRPDLSGALQLVESGVIFTPGADPGTRVVPADTGCPKEHVHGAHPCTGAPDPAPDGCGHGIVGLPGASTPGTPATPGNPRALPLVGPIKAAPSASDHSTLYSLEIQANTSRSPITVSWAAEDGARLCGTPQPLTTGFLEQVNQRWEFYWRHGPHPDPCPDELHAGVVIVATVRGPDYTFICRYPGLGADGREGPTCTWAR